MKQKTLMDKYTVFTFSINKDETSFQNIDEIVGFLKNKITNDPIATFIAVFDHYKHTKQLADFEIASDIQETKNIILCFGNKIPNPEIIAIRPRSIAVVNSNDKFVLSFMEAPNPYANKTMQEWIKAIVNK